MGLPTTSCWRTTPTVALTFGHAPRTARPLPRMTRRRMAFGARWCGHGPIHVAGRALAAATCYRTFTATLILYLARWAGGNAAAGGARLRTLCRPLTVRDPPIQLLSAAGGNKTYPTHHHTHDTCNGWGEITWLCAEQCKNSGATVVDGYTVRRVFSSCPFQESLNDAGGRPRTHPD